MHDFHNLMGLKCIITILYHIFDDFELILLMFCYDFDAMHAEKL